MAKRINRLKENVDGNFYVDSSCIDCGTCYWVAPANFKRDLDKNNAIVYNQPKDIIEQKNSYRALFFCPVNAIGTKKASSLFKDVRQKIPYKVNNNVYYTGFHSEKSFGATSYFIKKPSGNILIDSPRFLKSLAKKFESMGGISRQLLTHKDDIADTNAYFEMFKGKRYIHEFDKTSKTLNYEVYFKDDADIEIDEDVLAIPVPGHTKGSVCYLYKRKYLFTGDHLAYSQRLKHLYAFKGACWYDFKTQIKSMIKLLDYTFEYVLPGHGTPLYGDSKEIRASLIKCIDWMKS